MLRFIRILLFAIPASALAAGLSATTDPEAIADLRIATGQKDIAQAWLIDPVTRYAHFVQGSPYEPGGLRLRLADARVLTLKLDDRHVFEDRVPRLADLDGDGKDEIVLVLTSLSQGAALAVFAVEDGTIVMKARTPFIGQPHRWLAPAGIADFNGDGRLDVAFVAMPHLAKRLEIWTLGGSGLRRLATADNFANHRIGSRHTEMAAAADIDGDGISELIVPNGSRRTIRIVSLAGGEVHDLDAFELGSPADGVFTLKSDTTGWTLRVGTEAGRIEEFHF